MPSVSGRRVRDRRKRFSVSFMFRKDLVFRVSRLSRLLEMAVATVVRGVRLETSLTAAGRITRDRTRPLSEGPLRPL